MSALSIHSPKGARKAGGGRRGAVLAALCLLIVPVPGMGQNTVLIDFEIEDQFGNVYRDEDYRRGVVVLTGSDRGGSSFNGQWSRSIQQALNQSETAPEVRYVGLAHMKGVPGFLKKFVRGKFPQDPESWVLMDWKGVFNAAYGFTKKNANILVFTDGELVHQTFGREVEQEKLQGIVRAIDPDSHPPG